MRAQTTERLSDEEARALVFVREVGAIDNAAYRTINRADTLNASAHLRRLRDLGLLVMRGAGSRTYYVPGPAFVPIRGTSGGGEGVPAGAEAQDSQVEPHNLELDPHKLRLEPHKLPAQPHKLPRASSADLPPELRRRLEGLGTRPPRHIVEESLIALCAWSPSSARELAGWLNDRDPRELTRTYLRPMVADGRLALTFPEMPNHPEQKYELPDPGSRVDA